MKNIIIAFGILIISLPSLAQTGPFTATIDWLQIKDIGNPYNTVALNLDITNSPCANTNSGNRFEVLNNAQQSTVLAAVMANKEIKIFGTGTCNTANIEKISAIRIEP